MAVVGAVISGVGAVLGLSMQAKAAKAQQKAMQAQQRAQELADARARRRLLRESAIARGETLNIGANLGAMGGTALAGGLSGLTNQQQAQLGYQQSTLDISKFITRQNIAQSRYETLGSAFSSFGSMFKDFKGFPGSTVKSGYTPLSMSYSPNITGYAGR